MLASAAESVSSPLACMFCGDQKTHALSRAQLDELGLRGELRLFCAACGATTSWTGVETERGSERGRRAFPRVRLAVPIRVRCAHVGLEFTEVTTTLTASRRGASFLTRHRLRRGMTVAVVLPFSEADPNPIESPARVAWSDRKDEEWEVGVELIRS